MPIVKAISGHTSCQKVKTYLEKRNRALACDFYNLSWDEREIGYDLLPAYHRQGIMREAAARVIEYGFGELGLSLIDAEVNPRNEPSCRLLEKLGFQKGETSIEQQKEGVMREFMKYTLER